MHKESKEHDLGTHANCLNLTHTQWASLKQGSLSLLQSKVRYPEVVESDSGAQDVPVHRNEVWHQGVDEEAGTVTVDVHAVLLQQLLLVSPAL